jgi:hypothetical protein
VVAVRARHTHPAHNRNDGRIRPFLRPYSVARARGAGG